MLELVIFDLDGLLVNSEEIYGKGWKIGLEKIGASIDEKDLENMIGNGTSTNTKIILDIVKSMDKVNEVRKIREKFYFDCVENGKVHTLHFVGELLDILENKNIKKSVASSSIKYRVYNTLKPMDLFDKFDSIICGDDVENIKPKPDIYLKTLEKMNIKSNNAIALEDSITGVKAAIAAKIKVALVNQKDIDIDIQSPYFLGKFDNLEEVYNDILKYKL